MRLREYTLALLAVCSVCAAQGPYKITTSNANPSPGQVVVIEVDAKPGVGVSPSWRLERGNGDFKGSQTDVSRVEFVPSTPGQVVIIVCTIRTPAKEFPLTAQLTVGGQPPPPPAAAKPVVAQVPPQQNPQSPRPDAGVKTFRELADENVVPSGYMGDAMAANGESAKLDPGAVQGCRRDESCFRIEYTTAEAKLGWAAFAWQYVVQGGSNWGADRGYDLQRGSYQSLRIWARGQSDGGNSPRVQFKSGGNVAPEFVAKNKPSHSIAGSTVQLSDRWEMQCLDLRGRDLSNVVSPLTVVVTKASNPRGAVFFLDDIEFSQQPCPARQR